MDMTIAAMSEGQRALLSNILQRGLASLTKRERTDSATEAVDQLQLVLRTTPSLESASLRALLLLAFAPRGRTLSGVHRSVMLHLADRDHAEQHAGRWIITRRGWMRVWEMGNAVEVLSDRHGVIIDNGSVTDRRPGSRLSA